MMMVEKPVVKIRSHIKSSSNETIALFLLLILLPEMKTFNVDNIMLQKLTCMMIHKSKYCI